MAIKPNNDCSQCPHENGCKAAYEAMGQSSAPSIVGKVVLAFVVPIGLFVGLLFGLDKLLPPWGTEKIRTSVVFFLSLGLTLAAVWLANKRLSGKPAKPMCNNKDTI